MGKNCLARAVGAGYGQDTQRPKHPTAASEEPGAKTPGFWEPSRSCASPPPKGVGRPPKPRLPSPHIRTRLPRLGEGAREPLLLFTLSCRSRSPRKVLCEFLGRPHQCLRIKEGQEPWSVTTPPPRDGSSKGFCVCFLGLKY